MARGQSWDSYKNKIAYHKAEFLMFKNAQSKSGKQFDNAKKLTSLNRYFTEMRDQEYGNFFDLEVDQIYIQLV